MKIAILDDQAQDRQILIQFINQFANNESLTLTLAEFENADAFLNACCSSPEPDIVIIDIYLNDANGITGMDVARKLRESGFQSSLIFCTTSSDFAAESYRVHADGYLLKPYQWNDFVDSLWRCKNAFDEAKKCISFMSDRISYNLPTQSIIAFQADSKGCSVHTQHQTYFTWKKLCEFEAEIANESGFARIGKSYIVNLNYISNVENDRVVFTNKLVVPLPVRDAKNIRQMINDFMWQRARQNG